MTRARVFQIGLVLLPLALLLTGVAWAGASPDSAVDWEVLSGGGAPASAGGVTLNGSLGQTAIGPSAGGEVTLGAGFWYGIAGVIYRVYLPVTMRNG